MLIEETLEQKIDGMFRWVDCQPHALKASKSSRPSAIEAALRTLPKDLNETYERMLDTITEADRPHALDLLRWLAFAQSPSSLDELAECVTITLINDAAVDGHVDVADRGSWEDSLDTCRPYHL
ncbi:hypothetical protein LTR53_009839 [Teratosphaeriaceae sp. CCFEE 6253]|nr:hypothetical protein LTR53_009839 [Teratosphaeriaceae sp. CCFEE 6253]